MAWDAFLPYVYKSVKAYFSVKATLQVTLYNKNPSQYVMHMIYECQGWCLYKKKKKSYVKKLH